MAKKNLINDDNITQPKIYRTKFGVEKRVRYFITFFSYSTFLSEFVLENRVIIS